MIVSVKKYDPIFKNGKLDKNAIMRKYGNSDFETANGKTDSHTKTNIDILLSILKEEYILYSNFIWNGNRSSSNAQLSITQFIFDFDDGLTLDSINHLPFYARTLTTNSHTLDNHKFRVFIPLKETFTFKNQNHYKDIFNFIGDSFFDSKHDTKCSDLSRCYIAIPNAQTASNNADNLFDMKKIENNFREVTFRKKLEELNKKKTSIPRYSLNDAHKASFKTPSIETVENSEYFQDVLFNCSSGKRYENVFRLVSYCKYRGLSCSDTVSIILKQNFPNEYGTPKYIEKLYQYCKTN